jgi:hypothetical protein
MSNPEVICPTCNRASDTQDQAWCHGCGLDWCSDECALEAGAIITNEHELTPYLCRACQGFEVHEFELLQFCW